MDFDLGRSPTAAMRALRYVEDVVHRVRLAVRRPPTAVDPLTWLIRTHRGIHRDGDTKALRRGYEVAARMHEGQLRKSGEPYISHPLAVAQILAELGMDTTTLVAALLHDTVEDTSYTMSQLRADFGGEVALLVDGVTKFDRTFHGATAEVETIRKMLITAGADVRVLIVKLADRLHNMRTIDARSPASRVRIANATKDLLIPLCDRLGIQALKRELEDCVLKVLHPEDYAAIRAYVADRPEWTRYRENFIKLASGVLKNAGIRGRVVARPRHFYSIWKDTFGQGHNEPYELPRIAIIVADAENDCYTALGAIHTAWRPVPGRFKDFVASPKNNLYRSLHTTVVGPEEQPVEVLIRTEAMHRDAEYGIAAAFRFARRGPGAHSAKAGGRRASSQRANTRPTGGGHLDWLHRLLEWQREAVDPSRFLESLRSDLAEGQIHVFVDGERLLLPAYSTPVDVAYALGRDIGDRCVAATVNGQLVFLSSPLVDGDVVEIHTADEPGPDDPPVGPSPEWLSFVRTPHAQLSIEARLGLSEIPEDSPPPPLSARIRIGRSALRMELRRRERELASDAPLLGLAERLGYPDVESLLVAVADHRISADALAEQLIDQVDNLIGPIPGSGPIAEPGPAPALADGGVEAAVATMATTPKP